MDTKRKLKHLIKHFGFKKEELSEIQKMYDGEFFNPQDPAVLKLYKFSKQVCDEYNQILFDAKQKTNLFKTIKNMFKKTRLMNKMFPGHGLFGDIRQLDCVIGLVDLKNYVFLNKHTVFSRYALVTMEPRTMFGVRVTVGTDDVEKKGKLIKLGKIVIGKDCWLGAGAVVENGTTIEDGAVVAGGAYLNTDAPKNSLMLGRPAKVFAIVDENYKSKPKEKPVYTEEQKRNIYAVLKELGYKSVIKDYNKILNGERFNTAKPKLGGLFMLTHRLCAELNAPETTDKRKEQIKHWLFPNCGKNLTIGENFLIDILGVAVVGNNVAIGNNVCLAGNLFIGNNVTIKDYAVVFGSEHDLYVKKRNNPILRATWLDVMKINDNVTIEENAIIAPSSTVDKNVTKNALYTNKKIII